jgi:hypothetical protein
MKRAAAITLQVLIVALGLVLLAVLLYEPHVEGVNANATSLYDIYFDDPFLAYIYISFVAVFVGLYSAFKLAGYIGQGNVCSPQSVQALRTIKLSALSFAALIFAGAAYLVLTNRGEDDIAGGVAIALFLIVTSLVIAGVSARLGRKAASKILS